MEVIIGRESGSSRLHISGYNLEKFLGNPGSVPKSVSRQHCKLSVDAQGNCTIINLKPENCTLVNGVAVESKHITFSDRVELGPEHFRINQKEIIESVTGKEMPQTFSILPLQRVWDEYNDKKLQFQIKERKSASVQSVVGIISMLSIACGFIPGIPLGLRVVLYLIALVLGIYFFVIRYKQSGEAPLYLADLDKKFHEDYVCPNPKCRRFLGYSPYSDLRKTKGCYQCNAKYTEEQPK